MASIVYTISGGAGGFVEKFGFNTQWSGQFDLVPDLPSAGNEDEQVPFSQRIDVARVTTSVNGPLVNFSFSTTQNPLISTVEPGTTPEYTRFSTAASAVKYQSSGKSIDIWSPSLTSLIGLSFAKWEDIVISNPDGLSPGTFALSQDKFTLAYDYDQTYASIGCKGGEINIVYVP